MTIPVLICDDSSFARKQMQRALPEQWDVALSFASNGLEAMAQLRQGSADIMFLDLNMPDMDGYQVLELVRQEEINTLVIVVSGDVQSEARERIRQLGAVEFIGKPVRKEQVLDVLQTYGMLGDDDHSDEYQPAAIEIDYLDFFREIANVSMGRGIDLVSRLLKIYIPMPIPRVAYITVNELMDRLNAIESMCDLLPLYQGFIGNGIAGEILLIFRRPAKKQLSDLTGHDDELSDKAYMETMMDIASVLSGACLNGLSEQLDISFSLGHPRLMVQYCQDASQVKKPVLRSWTKTLAIEMGFEEEQQRLQCELLLLFTEDSVEKMKELASFVD